MLKGGLVCAALNVVHPGVGVMLYEGILCHATPRGQISWCAQVGGVNPDYFARSHRSEAKPKFDHQFTAAQIAGVPLLLIGDGRRHASTVSCAARTQDNASIRDSSMMGAGALLGKDAVKPPGQWLQYLQIEEVGQHFCGP
jgi:hypothetical protein